MNETTRTLLLKTRKQATSAFTAKQWFEVLTALGFVVEMIKQGSSLVEFTVNGPQGGVLTLVKRPGYKRIVFYDVATWAKGINLDLVELSSKALGLETPDVEKKLKDLYVRDLTNTGTCAICEGNYKRDGVNIGHHGFQRPGDGMLHGSCFGVGFLPFECSPNACEAYLVQLNKALKNAHEALENLPKSQTLTRKDSKYDYASGRTIVTFVEVSRATDSTEFERLLKSEIYQVTRRVEALNFDIKHFTAKVANWKPDELPEVKHAGKFAKAS
jgi:hypothetical protein